MRTTPLLLVLAVAACGKGGGAREAKALDANVTKLGERQFLRIKMKAPPLSSIKRDGEENTGYGIADATGDADVDVPLDKLPPGKHQLRFVVTPPYGESWAPLSVDYTYERELVLGNTDGGYVVPEGMFPACAAQIAVDPVDAVVTFTGCEGLAHVFAGKPVGTAKTTLPLVDVLGDVPLGGGDKQIVATPTLPVEVTHAGLGKKVTGKVELHGNWDQAFGNLIEKHRGKPVPLGGAEKPNDKNLALYFTLAQPLRVIGNGTLSDVDFIAFEDAGAGGYDVDCGSYSDDKGNRKRHTMRAVPSDVTIYDRRTGAEVATKHFAANAANACPKTITREQGAGTAGAASTTEMRSWVESFLAR